MKVCQFVDARDALLKVFDYPHFSPKARFYLMSIRNEVFGAIEAYITVYNDLLARLGGDGDDGHYEFFGEQAEEYQRVVSGLNELEADFSIDPSQFTINIGELANLEKKLPRSEWLALSANDLIALQGLVEITE